MEKLKRFLGITIIVLLVVFIAGLIFWNNAKDKALPETNGEVQIDGLDFAIDIYRDEMGIPQIFARTEHDLYFAQGYVHAQDRFWQMDFWRHQGAGRLSELMGDNLVETDAFLRTLGWERTALIELELLDAKTLAMLEAYADGVNTYISGRSNTELGLEYLFLNLVNSGYEPKPWEPLNTLTWAKAMAWDLRGNMDTEIERLKLLSVLTPEQVEFLFPAYPTDHPYIVTDPHLKASAAPQEVSELVQNSEITSLINGLSEIVSNTDDVLGLSLKDGIGSNSWVVSGDLTDTGRPILANDPHLSAQMPSIWYQIGLHCVPGPDNCDVDLAGFSFAGTPGIVIGHNAYISWGFTNVGPDVMDLYIEKINPDNPHQYEFEGEWVDMEVITESITPAGGDPVELEIRITQHGPIITDVYGLEEFHLEADFAFPDIYAVALSWTALEPGLVFDGIWGFNRASNWEEFREAAKHFVVPAQNLLYADIEGNIGYQMPGNIPIREGHDGRYPVPGWTGEYEWTGYIPFEDLPYAFNPPENYILTANNAVVSGEYPYFITADWAYGYRAQRILDMVTGDELPVTIADMQKMQGDNMNLSAAEIVPVLLDVVDTGEYEALLSSWDYQNSIESGAAALYETFWVELLQKSFADDLPEDISIYGGSRWFTVVSTMLDVPENYFWDDKNTEGVEDRDDVLQAAFEQAVVNIEKELGKNSDDWKWGDLHTITFEHGVMGSFPIAPAIFNKGEYQTAGGSSIVNATGWSASDDLFQVRSVPSMRMVLDVGNWTTAFTVHTTGQSGHPYSEHNVDMVDLWRLIEYYPMYWTLEQITTLDLDHLRLVP